MATLRPIGLGLAAGCALGVFAGIAQAQNGGGCTECTLVDNCVNVCTTVAGCATTETCNCTIANKCKIQ